MKRLGGCCCVPAAGQAGGVPPRLMYTRLSPRPAAKQACRPPPPLHPPARPPARAHVRRVVVGRLGRLVGPSVIARLSGGGLAVVPLLLACLCWRRHCLVLLLVGPRDPLLHALPGQLLSAERCLRLCWCCRGLAIGASRFAAGSLALGRCRGWLAPFCCRGLLRTLFGCCCWCRLLRLLRRLLGGLSGLPGLAFSLLSCPLLLLKLVLLLLQRVPLGCRGTAGMGKGWGRQPASQLADGLDWRAAAASHRLVPAMGSETLGARLRSCNLTVGVLVPAPSYLLSWQGVGVLHGTSTPPRKTL